MCTTASLVRRSCRYEIISLPLLFFLYCKICSGFFGKGRFCFGLLPSDFIYVFFRHKVSIHWLHFVLNSISGERKKKTHGKNEAIKENINKPLASECRSDTFICFVRIYSKYILNIFLQKLRFSIFIFYFWKLLAGL